MKLQSKSISLLRANLTDLDKRPVREPQHGLITSLTLPVRPQAENQSEHPLIDRFNILQKLHVAAQLKTRKLANYTLTMSTLQWLLTRFILILNEADFVNSRLQKTFSFTLHKDNLDGN